jgi:signal transduction histidine kinase
MRLTLDVALRRDRDPAEYRQALSEMSDDVRRLERLVVGLLELTRASERVTTGRPVALAAVLAKAAAVHGPARLDNPAAAEGVCVRGDPELLVAAVGNVLGNAARYAPGEPPTVRVEGANGTVRVVVADRGPGVAEADRERIFEPLTRLGGASSDGFGLGLAVARGAARAVGGDLTCRARGDGQSGAEFVFDLPRAATTDGG